MKKVSTILWYSLFGLMTIAMLALALLGSAQAVVGHGLYLWNRIALVMVSVGDVLFLGVGWKDILREGLS